MQGCGDVLTKKSLDKHRNQCRGASFTCLDCMVHFHGTEYRSHTSCMSEAQKVQGSLYKEKEKKSDKRKSINNSNGSIMNPKRAYVEDAPEGDDSQAVAIVDVPPRAPTPPSTAAEGLPENINVFDFLVSEPTPSASSKAIADGAKRRELDHSAYRTNGDSQFSQYSNDGGEYSQYGFSYGHTPVEPSFARYDSWQNLTDSQQSQALMPPPAYVTPAPKGHRREERERFSMDKSDKKRKRGHVEDLDLSSSKRPSSRDEMMIDAPADGRNGRVLHSGLTGGLNKLITDPDFLDDRIEAGPTPILSPIKRSRRDDSDKKSRRASSYISYGTTTIKPSSGKHQDDKNDRSRDIDRKYHDDKHRRRHSAERSHHDDKRRHRSPDRSYHDDKSRNRRQRESLSSEDRPNGKHLKAIEYNTRIERPSSVQPNANNQLVSYITRGDLFMSFITKGPDSERGCSINKILKRYHRERDVRGEAKEDEDKELWKSLRLRRNDRGEIVLFI